MKLHEDPSPDAIRITGYGEDFVVVNSVRHDRSLFVAPDMVVTDIDLHLDMSALAHPKNPLMATVDRCQCEILLLGTGRRQRFPPANVFALFSANRVALEVMDTRAACRTFNILAAESRRVAAMLFIETAD